MNDLNEAYRLFQIKAEQEGVIYFTDIVKENLQKHLAAGLTPEQAVEANSKEAAKFHGRAK